MKCLGCDVRVVASKSRSQSWFLFQLCPACLYELVPEFFSNYSSAKIKMILKPANEQKHNGYTSKLRSILN